MVLTRTLPRSVTPTRPAFVTAPSCARRLRPGADAQLATPPMTGNSRRKLVEPAQQGFGGG